LESDSDSFVDSKQVVTNFSTIVVTGVWNLGTNGWIGSSTALVCNFNSSVGVRTDSGIEELDVRDLGTKAGVAVLRGRIGELGGFVDGDIIGVDGLVGKRSGVNGVGLNDFGVNSGVAALRGLIGAVVGLETTDVVDVFGMNVLDFGTKACGFDG